MDWTKRKIIGMQCLQELFFRLGELRCDTIQSGRNVRLNYKTIFCKFSTYLVWYINTRKSCRYLRCQWANRWFSFPGSQQYTRKRRHVVEIEMEIEMDLVFPLKPIRKRNISKGWCFSGSCCAWISKGWIRNFSKTESVLDCIWGFVSS